MLVALALVPAVDPIESALVLGGLVVELGWSYGVAGVAWAYLGDRDPAAARRFLRRSLLVGVVLAVLVATVAVYAALILTATTEVTLATVLLLAGQSAYLMAAAVLLMTGHELLLLVALLPALAALALDQAGRTIAEPLRWIGGSVALAGVFALVATRGAARPVQRLGAPAWMRGLQQFGFGLLVALLVLFPAINELVVENYDALPLSVTLAALPLVVAMGVAEGLLHRFRARTQSLLASTSSSAAFARSALRTLLRYEIASPVRSWRCRQRSAASSPPCPARWTRATSCSRSTTPCWARRCSPRCCSACWAVAAGCWRRSPRRRRAGGVRAPRAVLAATDTEALVWLASSRRYAGRAPRARPPVRRGAGEPPVTGRRPRSWLVVACCCLLALVSCDREGVAGTPARPPATAGAPTVPWQYQLQGPVDTGVDAGTFVVDGFDVDEATVADLHRRGRTVICYINAGAVENWRPDAARYPAEVVGIELDGWKGERWLDVRRLDVICSRSSRSGSTCAGSKGFTGSRPTTSTATPRTAASR